MESAFETEISTASRPAVAASRASLGTTEECRQFPHRIAFLCLAGDAVVAFGASISFQFALYRFPIRFVICVPYAADGVRSQKQRPSRN